MKKQLLCLLLITCYLLTKQSARSQDLVPVYEVDTLAAFENLGAEFQTIIYGGSIWKRRQGRVPAGKTDLYIPASEGDYYERQQSGRNVNARTTGDLTLAMLSKPDTTLVITDTLDLEGQTVTIAKTSNISFQGGALKNGTIVNNFISIRNLNGVLAEKNFRLDSSYVYLSNNVTINVNHTSKDSYTIESNGVVTITLTQLAFNQADVTIRNCRIIKQTGAFKFLNFVDGTATSSKLRCQVLIENCTISQTATGNNSDDSWAIVIGSQPADEAATVEQLNVRFTCRNTNFTNIGLAVYEADCDISRCYFKAGPNNSNNKELLHLGGGSTRLTSSVKDCVFDANLIQSDVLDLYNSSNRVIERCRFKGANAVNYITIKSLFNHDPDGLDTGIDSDQIGPQSNIVISSSLFEGNVSRDYGAIAIYTSDRQNDTLPVPDNLKRYNVKVDKCTFKLSGAASTN